MLNSEFKRIGVGKLLADLLAGLPTLEVPGMLLRRLLTRDGWWDASLAKTLVALAVGLAAVAAVAAPAGWLLQSQPLPDGLAGISIALLLLVTLDMTIIAAMARARVNEMTGRIAAAAIIVPLTASALFAYGYWRAADTYVFGIGSDPAGAIERYAKPFNRAEWEPMLRPHAGDWGEAVLADKAMKATLASRNRPTIVLLLALLTLAQMMLAAGVALAAWRAYPALFRRLRATGL